MEGVGAAATSTVLQHSIAKPFVELRPQQHPIIMFSRQAFRAGLVRSARVGFSSANHLLFTFLDYETLMYGLVNPPVTKPSMAVVKSGV